MRSSLLLLFIALGFALGLQFAPAWAFTTDSQEDICATPAVVFCDNFEARPLTTPGDNRVWNLKFFKSLGWNLSCCPINTTVNIVNTQAKDGVHSVQYTYPANNGSGGIVTDFGIGGPLADAYIRWYTKWGNPIFQWSGNSTKHLLILNQQFNQTNEYNFFPGGASDPVMAVQYSSQIQNQASILGPNVGPAFPGTNQNQWYCYEVHIKGNTATTSQDGVLEMWIDGVQYYNYVGYNLDNRGGPYLINGVNASGYWNCATDPQQIHPCNSGAPADTHPVMYRYLDNIVISKQRIGCLGTGTDTAPPSVPTGLIIH
jgi:hypothetical protein